MCPRRRSACSPHAEAAHGQSEPHCVSCPHAPASSHSLPAAACPLSPGGRSPGSHKAWHPASDPCPASPPRVPGGQRGYRPRPELAVAQPLSQGFGMSELEGSWEFSQPSPLVHRPEAGPQECPSLPGLEQRVPETHGARPSPDGEGPEKPLGRQAREGSGCSLVHPARAGDSPCAPAARGTAPRVGLCSPEAQGLLSSPTVGVKDWSSEEWRHLPDGTQLASKVTAGCLGAKPCFPGRQCHPYAPWKPPLLEETMNRVAGLGDVGRAGGWATRTGSGSGQTSAGIPAE